MSTMSDRTSNIVYVGRKRIKTDTVTRSGFTWAGYGASQKVPYDLASKLLGHPDVWVTEEEFKKNFPPESPHKETKPANPEGVKFESKPGDFDGDGEDGEDGENHEGSGTDQTGGDEDKEPSGGLSAVKNAINSLDSDNESHFGKQGPKVAAVREAAADESITSAQVKAAWAELNK